MEARRGVSRPITVTTNKSVAIRTSGLRFRFLLSPGADSGMKALRWEWGIPINALVIGVLIAGMEAGRADIRLAPLFSDHAILQRADKVPVWGHADSGEKVTVTFDKISSEATADSSGKWCLFLNTKSEGEGPFQLVAQGKNKVTVDDVLVGEVWLCSGQSNMANALRDTFGTVQQEIAGSANPKFRQFKVQGIPSPTPLDTCKGKWELCSPATAGEFTAVGYYFGKKLCGELQTPVGLINSSWPATPVEAWTSSEGLDSDPDLKARKDFLVEEATTLPKRMQDYLATLGAWQKKYHREDHAPADVAAMTGGPRDTEVKKVTVPGPFASAGLPDAGAVWIWKTIPVPTPVTGHEITLGQIDGFDTVYWNGTKVGETSPELIGSTAARRYILPSSDIKPGEATIAIRVFNPCGGLGITGVRNAPPIQALGVPLTGEWQAKAEFSLPPLNATAVQEYPRQPDKLMDSSNLATFLFNGMINPIAPYAIRGVIWYQGENNINRAFQYRTAFPLMIKDWRARWGGGDLPFYFCQLANFSEKKETPEESVWAELREAQSQALSLPDTAMAVLIDIGEAGDIHPRDKRDVGERLARIALGRNYGKGIIYAGPRYRSMSVEGDKIRLAFSDVNGGLRAKTMPGTYVVSSRTAQTKPLVLPVPDCELQGFAICGVDKQWKWAHARIEKDSVVVWSPEIPQPVAVRYAWANNPTCNLYNAADLPAGPFRTDDFPLRSQDAKY